MQTEALDRTGPEPSTPAAFPEALLRLRSVVQMAALSRTEIYRRMDEGRFPRPVQLGEGRVAWRQSDIVRWIEALPMQPAKPPPSPVVQAALAKARRKRRG